jgi:hypothetical protein
MADLAYAVEYSVAVNVVGGERFIAVVLILPA